MKKSLAIIGAVAATAVSAMAQGYFDVSWTAGFSGQGVKIAAPSTPGTQQAGWFLGNDYTAEAFVAAGAGAAETSLVGVSATKIAFGLGMAGVTAAGNGPLVDGAGLFQAGAQNLGVALGSATLQIRAWYNPGGNTYATFADALAAGVNTGKSGLYTISAVASSDPTIGSLDAAAVGFQPFTVSAPVPEPSSFALAGLGAAAMLIFRRRK